MDPIAQAFHDAFTEVDDREIYEWAEDSGNIDLCSAYAIPGPFHLGPSRHLIEPFKAIKSRSIRTVTVKKAVQTAGTLLADIAVPWYIQNRPGPIMWNMQTDEVAEDHARDRAIPTIKTCRSLQPLLPRDSRKLGVKGGEFPHMSLYIQGSTPAQLQSKSILFLINDELWRWLPGRYNWAIARVTAFQRVGISKILNISQAGKKGDDLDIVYRKGTMEEWHVPCESCNGYFFPIMRGYREGEAADRLGKEWGLMWDTNETTKPGGQWNFGALAKTLRYECPHCAHAHKDTAALKAFWNLNGKYAQQNPTPSPDNRSFRWTSLPFDSWAFLAELFCEAMEAYQRGIIGDLVNFKQQRLAEDDDPETLHQGESERVEKYDLTSEWPDEVARAMVIDQQEEHYWTEGMQFDANGNGRRLFFKKVTTEDELETIRDAHKIPLNCTFLDVGNVKKDNRDVLRAYETVCRFGWCGLKGEDRADLYPHVGTKPGVILKRIYSKPHFGDPRRGKTFAGKRYAKYFMFVSHIAADIVDRIRKGKGVKWSGPEDREHTRQLFAEQKRKKLNERTGKDEWTWVQTRRDNHVFDLWKMLVVVAMMHPAIKMTADVAPPPTDEQALAA